MVIFVIGEMKICKELINIYRTEICDSFSLQFHYKKAKKETSTYPIKFIKSISILKD